MPPKTSKNLVPIHCRTGAIAGIICWAIQFITGWSTVSQTFLMSSATSPTRSMIASRHGCTCICHTSVNFCDRLSRTGAIYSLYPSRSVFTTSPSPSLKESNMGLIYASYIFPIRVKVFLIESCRVAASSLIGPRVFCSASFIPSALSVNGPVMVLIISLANFRASSITPRKPSVNIPMISAVICCASSPAKTDRISANASFTSPTKFKISADTLKIPTSFSLMYSLFWSI